MEVELTTTIIEEVGTIEEEDVLEENLADANEESSEDMMLVLVVLANKGLVEYFLDDDGDALPPAE